MRMKVTDSFFPLPAILRRRAEQHGDARAYTFLRDGEREERFISYAELDQECRALAAMLQQWEIKRAILVYPPGLDFIVAFFGCLYAGVVPIPAGLSHLSRVGPSLTRIRSIAQDAEPDAVLSITRVIDRVLADPQFNKRAPELARARWLSSETIDQRRVPSWEEPKAFPDTPALLQYTSGSTSLPKGVVVTHGNLLHNLELCSAFAEDVDSVSVSWLPHSHDMGLIESILAPAFAGYPAYLMAPAAFLSRPFRWLAAISRYRATKSGGPNFAYDLCVEKIAPEDLGSLDLSTWRVAYNGSETVRPETLLRFNDKFGICGFKWDAFSPVYGLAESTLLVSGDRRSDSPVLLEVDAEGFRGGRILTGEAEGASTTRIVACGRPSAETHIVIVSPDDLLPLPDRRVGEIWVSSPSVAAGYWRRADETKQVFCASFPGKPHEEFLRTGDLGFLLDGRLYVTGRLKDVINIRGHKHYPQDIEQTMARSHAAIHAHGCAAFSVPAEGVEQLAVIAEVQPRYRKRSENLADSIIAAIQQSVVDQHGLLVHAGALVSYGSIPRTTSGKLERYACRNLFMAGNLQTTRVWNLAV